MLLSSLNDKKWTFCYGYNGIGPGYVGIEEEGIAVVKGAWAAWELVNELHKLSMLSRQRPSFAIKLAAEKGVGVVIVGYSFSLGSGVRVVVEGPGDWLS